MRILIADDDKKYAAHLRQGLEQNGFSVDCACDGEDAYLLTRTFPYDVVILDVVMPKRNGYDVLLQLRRENYPAPILMATQRSGERDRMAGFDDGADDYLVKPIYVSELAHRIRLLLKRGSARGNQDPYILEAGGLKLDLLKFRVERAGRMMELTRKEFELLECLMRQPGRVVSQAVLLQSVWNMDYLGGSNVVETHVRHLRVKLGDQGGELLQTRRGFGYCLEPSQTIESPCMHGSLLRSKKKKRPSNLKSPSSGRPPGSRTIW